MDMSKTDALNGLLHKTRIISLQKLNRRFLLNSKIEDLINPFPLSLLPANPELGQAWLSGDYPLKGAILKNQSRPPFDCTPPNDEWLAHLFAFDWLVHVCALEHPHADALIINSIQHWIGRKPFKDTPAWTPDIVARRIISLSACSPRILPLLTNQGRIDFIQSLNIDARYLSKSTALAQDGLPRLMACAGYVFATFALNNGTVRLNHAMSQLIRELKRQIHADGLHTSRAPDAMMSVLPVLLTIQDGLKRRQLSVPSIISDTVKQSGTALKFLQHRDGHLSVFQGGLELGPFTGASKPYLNALIRLCGVHRNPKHGYLSAGQYYRVEADKTLILLDAGAGRESDSHLAPTSFEMSRGIHRVIVNCGPNYVHGYNWRQASRQAAAHTVLGLPAATPDGQKIKVTSKRLEDQNATWLETAHDMYRNSHGLDIHRRLFIHHNGADLRGEELIMPAGATSPKPLAFALRLHLHPTIKASPVGTGHSILLALPNGEGWQFSSSPGQAALSLEQSVYMGANGSPRQSRQIVLEGQVSADGLALKWGLKLMRQ